MAEDSPQPTDSPQDSGRAKRPPPTIDLEATDVTADAGTAAADPEPAPSRAGTAGAGISAIAIPAVTGAGAAALVIVAVWLMGWPGQAPAAAPPPAANTAALDDLATRVASVEAKISKPAATDSGVASRIDALEKSLASLRGNLDSVRVQSDKLTAAVSELKSAPREVAAAPDLSAINDRIAALEKANRAQDTEIAQGSAKAADDMPLRRIVAAALLDVTVRTGEPFPSALAAAKALAPNPDELKPLEGFAKSGVPNAFSLSRELLALVPKLSPAAPETASVGPATGLVARLEAGASKLVRIERTDAVGNDRNAVVSRATAAALRNDYSEARRELMTLPPDERAAAQPWIDKADARDAALAASRKFAAEAMTALAKPAQ